MNLFLYSIAWWLATPLVMAYLLWRSRLQPEYRQHWLERWALRPAPRIDGPVVWVHAVSVGETRAAQPLVNALLERDPLLTILLTHMTPTGRQTGEELFGTRHGTRVIQRYLPYDYADAMRRFLRTWRPQLGIVLETELWPNLAAAARSLDVPVALVNARLSEHSLRKGQRWQSLMTPAIRSLGLVLAQTEADAARIRQLGRADVPVVGNMKFDIDPPQVMLAKGKIWRSIFGERPVVLAASTRDGEEALLLDAWLHADQALQSQVGDQQQSADEAAALTDSQPAGARAVATPPLLVIVPRHPQRFDEVEREVLAHGLRMARRSAMTLGQSDAEISPPIDVLLGDSMGEMFAYYGMADVAIIGGSLLPFGAQNLIEACSAGVPVVLGPHTYNFADAAEQSIEVGAGVRVTDAGQAVRVSLQLLADPHAHDQRSRRAIEFTQAHRGATQRTLTLLENLIEARKGPAEQ